MEILLDADTIKFFHSTLVNLYKDTGDPITLGHSDGMIEICAERPFTDIYTFIPFPHVLHKASVLMESIIRFHPFVDGNKRVALLATYYFLFWNGYDLIIPEDAADFTIEIAEGKHNLSSILSWLSRHSVRNWRSILRNKVLTISIFSGVYLSLAALFILPWALTPYPFMYFRYLISRKTKE